MIHAGMSPLELPLASVIPSDRSQFAIQDILFRKLNRQFHRFALVTLLCLAGWNDCQTQPDKLEYQCTHQIVELQPMESFKYIPI